MIPLINCPISTAEKPNSPTKTYLKIKNKTANNTTAIPMALPVNLAVCVSPSSKSSFTLFFGKSPIGLPSGVTTYLFFKIKNVMVPMIIAIEAARNPHLKAKISLIPVSASFTSPTQGQIN